MALGTTYIKFEMLKNVGSKPRPIDAMLCVNRAKSQHAVAKHDGWKAVISFPTLRMDRLFGVWRPTIREAVESILTKHSHRITQSEQRRIGASANAMDRHSPSLATKGLVPPSLIPWPSPRSGLVPSDASPGQGTPLRTPRCNLYASSLQVLRNETAVHYIHQIYGLFGDEKPMPELFQESHRSWKAVADNVGAQYHLWTAAELETLVKQHYPQYWDMYCDVRYPVMRCDIGRIAIIHSYGGLYADLDVQPNRLWYEQTEFALARVKPLTDKRPPRGSGSQPRTPTESKNAYYVDMEVIIGTAGNAVFIDWLDYIRQQLVEKQWRTPGSFWYNAKMRYVFHTTGPYALKRFVNLRCQAQNMKSLKYVECNYFKDEATLSMSRRRLFDVISYQSQSYFTKDIEILVPVGLGVEQLPALPTTKRMRSKNGVRRMGSSCLAIRDSDPVTPPTNAYSNPERHSPAGLKSPTNDECDIELAINMIDHMAETTVDALIDAMIMAVETVDTETGRVTRLRQYMWEQRKSISTKVVIGDMPLDLQVWLQKP